jgi:hypothetical protein
LVDWVELLLNKAIIEKEIKVIEKGEWNVQ